MWMWAFLPVVVFVGKSSLGFAHAPPCARPREDWLPGLAAGLRAPSLAIHPSLANLLRYFSNFCAARREISAILLFSLLSNFCPAISRKLFFIFCVITAAKTLLMSVLYTEATAVSAICSFPTRVRRPLRRKWGLVAEPTSSTGFFFRWGLMPRGPAFVQNAGGNCITLLGFIEFTRHFVKQFGARSRGLSRLAPLCLFGWIGE